MRKDFMDADDDQDTDETAFIENYWTEVWKRQGGPKAETRNIARKDEYKVIAPFVKKIPQGARILDGGCGLGDWTAFFTEQNFDCIGLDLSRETVANFTKYFPK